MAAGDEPAPSKAETAEALRRTLEELDRWLEHNGWDGWDPYDLWDNRAGRWMMGTPWLPARAAWALVSRLEEMVPLLMRRLVGARRQVNPKAMGLFAKAYRLLAQLEGTPRSRGGKAAHQICLDWLYEHRVTRYGGCGWGYPFDWMSRTLIPRNTPTVVNSAIIGDAFWTHYLLDNDQRSLAVCRDICVFFMEGLHRTPPAPDGSFCFSYTPVDRFEVHNANLFGAEFLVRVGTACGEKEWVETGRNAARFSLNEVRDDGTLDYWSRAQSLSLLQDTYHSGFEIRAFHRIGNTLGDAAFRAAAQRYFETWLRDFFRAGGVPSFGRGDALLEVHCCAEGLLCAAEMNAGGNYDDAAFRLHVANVLRTAREGLWIATPPHGGYFGWIRRPGMAGPVAIPFIRWGEAWMFAAMVEALIALQRKDGSG